MKETLKEGSKLMVGGAFSMFLLFVSMYTYGDLNISRDAIFATALYFIGFAVGCFAIYKIWGYIKK